MNRRGAQVKNGEGGRAKNGSGCSPGLCHTYLGNFHWGGKSGLKLSAAVSVRKPVMECLPLSVRPYSRTRAARNKSINQKIVMLVRNKREQAQRYVKSLDRPRNLMGGNLKDMGGSRAREEVD